MNIFFVDKNPIIAAQSLHLDHVVKMIVESAQLLSTAHRVLDGEEKTIIQNNRRLKRWILNDEREEILYKSTMINHPCNIWVRESDRNYIWLFRHLKALSEEYTFRFDKIHKTTNLFSHLQILPNNIPKRKITKPYLAMPEIYHNSDIIQAYRTYYNNEKLFPKNRKASWGKRNIPDWVKLNV